MLSRSRLPIKHELLHRKRLDSLLRRSISNPLVTVVAASGYGKTQAVAQFVYTLKQRLVWVNLSELDNDITHFWQTLINALKEELPTLAKEYEVMGFPQNMSEYDLQVRRVVKDLQEGDDVLMVIDNYSLIENPVIRDFFEGFIRLQAESCTIILISSKKRDSDIGWRLVGSSHVSITAEDLQFTSADCVQYFEQLGLSLSMQEVEKIADEMEGWPLALFLAGKRMQEGLASFDVKDASITQLFGFFSSSLFDVYEASYRELLVSLALLPRFSFEMLEFLSEGDFREQVNQLESNMFINQDFATGLWAFHRLYKDFLLQKSYLLDESKRNQLYAATGQWFLDHRHLLEAMDCFSQAARYDKLMETIASFPSERTSVSLSNYTLRYLEAIPVDYQEAHSVVDFSKAYMYLNRAEAIKAEAMFRDIIEKLEGIERSANDERLLGESYAVLGDILLMFKNDDGFGKAYYNADLHLPTGSVHHNTELMGIGNNEVFFLPHNNKGAFEHIVKVVFEGRECIERVLRGQSHGFEFLFLAEGQFYRGEFDEANKSAYHALFKGESKAQHDIVCNAYYLMAQIAWMQGGYDEVISRIKDISTYLSRHKATGLRELEESVQSWLSLVMGEPEQVVRWVLRDGQFQANLSPIGRGRSELLHAYYLRAVGRYIEALAYLTQMESMYAEKKLWATHLRHRILKACCYVKIGDKNEAVEELWRAYEQSYDNGISIPFIEQDTDMLSLLDLVRKQNNFSFEPKWIEEMKNLASAQARRRERMIRFYRKASNSAVKSGFSLSKREHEVLLLMSRGLTRDEVGNELGVSINSVKRYIANLYQKLGAVNRADAIRIAAARGNLE